MRKKKSLAATLFLFYSLFFCLVLLYPESIQARKQTAPDIGYDATQEIKAERFLRLSPRERIIRFQQLPENEQLAIYERLRDEERENLFAGLGPEGRKSLLELLPPGEKRKWVSKYPELGVVGREEKEAPPVEEVKAGVEAAVQPPSRIEKILSGGFPTDIARDLKQYGYDFFDRSLSTFAPIANVPVGPDYAIGPGDQFTIHLWGKAEMSYDATVTRDGTIVLPRLGSLDVNGLTFAELKKFLYHKFKAFYPHFQMSITMGHLRTIEIFLVGEAKKPGTYAISSLSTVISALSAAGGPSKRGSLRNIKLFRGDKQAGFLDLYDFFIHGVKQHDMRLQPGDTLFIPVVGPVVGVAGNVKRPAIYELKGHETIGDVMALAGGVMPTGYLQNVQVERVVNHRRRVMKSFNLDPGKDSARGNLATPLRDGDLIRIYPVFKGLRKIVYLEGHVKYPRAYELKPGMRIRDVIPSYDALLPEPYLSQAEIIRLMEPDLRPAVIAFDLGGLLAGDASQNLKLRDLDHIKVYGLAEREAIPQVTIEGAVRKPGTYRLLAHMKIKDLIFKAGNFTKGASKEKGTLSRLAKGKDGTDVAKFDFSPERALEGLGPDNMELRPDDRVHIRELPLYHQALQRKVYLEGEFRFPGEYTYSAGEKLAAVIKRAGGVTRTAYPYGALFFRNSAKSVQQQRMNEYVGKLEEDILTLSAQSAATALDKDQAAVLQQTLTAKKQLLDKLKKARVTGRMVINVPKLLENASSRFNFDLRPGDRLVIPERPEHVNVLGEVFNPTAILSEKGKSVAEYLEQVGGTTDDAAEDRMYVVKANGEVLSKGQEGFFGMVTWDSQHHRWTMGGFEGLKLDPGDTIIVPKQVEKYPWLRLTKDITQILYQIAVTAGVIIVAY